MFEDNTNKVNYVLSYLKGTALDCLESVVLDPIKPQWLSDFNLFIEELKANFGTYNPVGEAEAKLEGLRMHDSHQATKYFIKFQQLAARIQWGEAALRRQAYNRLTKRIKDDMVHHSKPNTLSGLWKLIQAIDARYWERHGEVSRETHASGTSGTSGNKSKQKSDSSKSDSTSGNSFLQSKQKDGKSGTSISKDSPSEPKEPASDYSSKLGKDGKLTPQERQRRLDNNLCLFCGTSGHVAKDCSKPSSATAKARVAKAEQISVSTSGSDSKKN